MVSGLTFINALAVPKTSLGEGLHYSAHEQALYWVDIKSPTLYRYCLRTRNTDWRSFSETICWVNQTQEHRLVIGCQSGIYYYNFNEHSRKLIWRNSLSEYGIRLNDAKTDRRGRLFFGTMDNNETKTLGNLYRLNGQDDCLQVDQGYIVSNGPAVSLNSQYLYSVSSSTRIVYRFNLSATGLLINKQTFINWPEEKGYPDGITVDSQDNIWIASWGAGSVLCFNSDGTLLLTFEIPAPFITNIIFAGNEYKDVFITTATHPMSNAQIQQQPLAGKVLHYRAEVAGVPEVAISI